MIDDIIDFVLGLFPLVFVLIVLAVLLCVLFGASWLLVTIVKGLLV